MATTKQRKQLARRTNALLRNVLENREREEQVEKAVRTAYKRARAQGVSTVYAGIAGGDGSFTSYDTIERAGFRMVRKGNATTIELSGNPSPEYVAKSVGGYGGETTSSQSLDEEIDPFNYDSDGVINPKYSYDMLTHLMGTNETHAACIETKSADIAYKGWYLETTQEAKDLIDKGTLARAKSCVESFLKGCGVGQWKSIENVCYNYTIYHESLGVGSIECMRNSLGFLSKLKVTPFRYIRLLNQRTQKQMYAKYMQSRFNKKVYFTAWGDNVHIVKDKSKKPTPDNILDPTSASIEEFPAYDDREGHIVWRNDLRKPQDRKKAARNWKDAATELYVNMREPFTLSETYGTPSGYQALDSMLAHMRISAYNLNFFSSKGVPQFAVVIEGLSPVGQPRLQLPESADDGTEDTPQDLDAPNDPITLMKNTIMEFFTNRITAQDRSVLVLTAFGNATIKFERLSSESIEASFKDYENRCTEKIRLSHRVPGAAMGILETANLGSGRDDIQMERYRDHIVAPGQSAREAMVNDFIRTGLLIPYFNFRFVPMTLKEAERQRDFCLKAMINGGITRNEFREELDKKPFQDPLANALFVAMGTQATIIGDDLEGSVLDALDKTTRRVQESERRMGQMLAAALPDHEKRRLLSYDQHSVEESESEEHTAEGS